MPKVRCKACKKEWTDLPAYIADKGCHDEGCPHNKKAAVVADKKANLQHVKMGSVISTYDDTKPCRFLEVPKVISVHIFPRKGKR